jgi:hypothetical protein
MVVYANDPGRSRFGGSQQAQIEEGAMVREGQALVRLPDLSKMQVSVTIHESRVDQVRPGIPARILIQDEEYQGKVLRVANQPQATSWFSANVKEYATTVSIEGDSEGLRPGMTAKVTILVDNLTDALTVPVSAVVEQRGGFYCWVKSPQGPERRQLGLGPTNDKLIAVVDGVKEGDVVFRNPRAVVDEARQEPPFEKQFADAKFSAAAGGDSGADSGVDSGAGRPADALRPPAGDPSASAAAPPGGGAPEPPRADSRSEGPPGETPGSGARRSFDLMQFDTDGDGKVSRDEAPERMQGMFERLDPNGDGFIDRDEVAEMKQRFRSRSRGPGGGGPRGAGGGGGPGGPAGGAPPGGGAAREAPQ